MTDLSTTYMGLKLRNPIIVASSDLTKDVESIIKLDQAGAGAVVLKSIFEEQILIESDSMQSDHLEHTEASEYLLQYTRQKTLSDYINLIKEAKKAVSIPVIASINCVSASEWIDFAAAIEEAGADALELNIFVLPGDKSKTSEEIEQIYFDIIDMVKDKLSIPVSFKTGFYFTSMANMLFRLSLTDLKGLVLFNRYYKPDIDINTMEVCPAPFLTSPEDYHMTLRWIGMLAGEAKCDLAATTGIHDSEAVIKHLLAGASAVQIASVLYQKGPEFIKEILAGIEKWMQDKKLKSMSSVIGKLKASEVDNPFLYERVQFMKYIAK